MTKDELIRSLKRNRYRRLTINQRKNGYNQAIDDAINLVEELDEPTVCEMQTKIHIEISEFKKGLDELEDRLTEMTEKYADSINLFTINLKPEVTIDLDEE